MRTIGRPRQAAKPSQVALLLAERRAEKLAAPDLGSNTSGKESSSAKLAKLLAERRAEKANAIEKKDDPERPDIANGTGDEQKTCNLSDTGSKPLGKEGATTSSAIVAVPCESSIASVSGTQRATVLDTLQRALVVAGASAAEVDQWAISIEACAWSSAWLQQKDAALEHEDDESEVGSALAPAIHRLYRAEARRLVAALRVTTIGADLVTRMREGTLRPDAVLALPPEELLPLAKRARLETLRRPDPRESGRRQLPHHDKDMPCNECGKIGTVYYRHLACAKDYFQKAEVWGNKENDVKGDRCEAECSDCLAQWEFEM